MPGASFAAGGLGVSGVRVSGRGGRWGELGRVVAAIVAEAALLVLLWRSAPVLGSVAWSRLGWWVSHTDPTTAVLASLRVLGMVVSAWMLVSTVVYLGASLAGSERLVRGSGWVTLPVIRRMVDGVAAASILASALASSASASSGLLARAPAVVMPVHPSPGPAAPGGSAAKPPVTAAAAASASRSSPAVGRHIPHPGVVEHAALASYRPPTVPASGVPSEANGFAGLAPGTKVVVVRPGDCLSVIAEEHLGSWQKDVEIHDLNVGRLQPDGRSLTDDHWIYPGWVLVMPADAVDTMVVPGPPSDGQVPARPAPVLARHAPAHSTSVPASHQAAPISSGHEPPMRAGEVPGVARPATAAPTRPLVAGRAGQRSSSTVARSPRLRPSGGHPPSGQIRTDPSVSAAPRPPDISLHSQESGRSVVTLPVELLGAGVLSAGVVALLGRLALVAQGRRRRGRRTRPTSADGARVELAARAGADEDLLALVDLGCRFLAVQLRDAPSPPPVLGVEATSEWLAVLLAEKVSRAPEGWSVGPEGQSWVLTEPSRLHAVTDRLDVPHPFPALVTIGVSQGVTILLNLAAVGVLSVGGDTTAAAGVVAAAGVELSTVPWTEGCEVVLVGFGDGAGLGVCEQVRVVDTLEECIDGLLAEAADRVRLVESGGTSSLDEHRLAGDGVDCYPSVVLCLEQPDPASLARLEELASDPRSGLMAVLVAGAEAASTVAVDPSGCISLDQLGRTVTAQRIPLTLLERIDKRIAEAADTADCEPGVSGAGEDWWPAAADTAPTQQMLDLDEQQSRTAAAVTAAAGAPSGDSGTGRIRRLRPGVDFPLLPADVISPAPEVVVRILADEPMVLRRAGDGYEPVEFKRTGSREAVVYLACHPGGVSVHRLSTALQPHLSGGGAPSSSTFGPEVSAARTALGKDRHGRPYLPVLRDAGGVYRLADSVVSDWHLLQVLVAAAAEASTVTERIALLETALAMVGPDGPLSELRSMGVRPKTSGRKQHWRWLQVEILGQLESDVIDVAAELADLYLRAGDPAAAARAARHGLKVSPLSQDLHASNLTAAAAKGAGALEVAWAETERVFEAEGEPFDGIGPELKAHYRQLRAKVS